MNWTRRIIFLALGLAAWLALTAVTMTTPSNADYSFFKIIADRNIFNPNRRPHVVETFRSPGPVAVTSSPAMDTLSLVGTLTYEKGTFAFFDGSGADYKKVLKRDGEIAGFKVAAIRPGNVLLSSGDKKIELKVGAQMNHDADAGWRMVQEPLLPLAATTNAPGSLSSNASSPAASSMALSAPAGSSSIDQNDILKKLMQQRERELK